MKQQTIDWAKDLLETCLKSLNQNKEEITLNDTDIRCFHSIDSMDSESDMEDILAMTDEDLDSELAALGFTEECIDENLAIHTSKSVIPFPSKKTSFKESNLPRKISNFEDKLLTTLIKQAIDQKINSNEVSLYSLEAAGLRTQPTASTAEVTKLLPLINKASEEEILNIKEQEIQPEVASMNIIAPFSMAAALLIMFFTAFIINDDNIKNAPAQSFDVAGMQPIDIDQINTKHMYLMTKDTNISTILQDIDFGYLSEAEGENPYTFQSLAISKYSTKSNGSVISQTNDVEDTIKPTTWITKEDYNPSMSFLIKNATYGLLTKASLKVSSFDKTASINQNTPARESVRSNQVLQYDSTMVFLNRLSNGEIEATKIERLKILRKLLDVAKSDALQAQLNGKDYQSSNTCAAKGVYEHPVSSGDTISGIILEECLYKLKDSALFEATTTLNIGDIVVINVGEDRVVNKVTVSRTDGSISKIYNTGTL